MKLRYQDILFMAAGGLLFLALVLVPFAFRSTHQTFIVASSLNIPGCVVNGTFPNVNQCMDWIAPGILNVIRYAGALALIGYATVGTAMYSKHIVGRQRLYRFAMYQAITAIFATAITATLYVIFRSHSQGVTVAANQHPHVSLWVPVHEQLFGPGLPVAAVVVFAVLYIVGSSMQWYVVRLSPWRIAGFKKDELFQ